MSVSQKYLAAVLDQNWVKVSMLLHHSHVNAYKKRFNDPNRAAECVQKHITHIHNESGAIFTCLTVQIKAYTVEESMRAIYRGDTEDWSVEVILIPSSNLERLISLIDYFRFGYGHRIDTSIIIDRQNHAKELIRWINNITPCTFYKVIGASLGVRFMAPIGDRDYEHIFNKVLSYNEKYWSVEQSRRYLLESGRRANTIDLGYC